LRSRNPASASTIASVTDATPGRKGTPASATAERTPGVLPGLTRNRAPAATDASTSADERTVPIPSTISGTSSAMTRAQSSARGVRRLDDADPTVDEGAGERRGRIGIVEDDDRDHGREGEEIGGHDGSGSR
jgi:hypothetical protein